MMVNVALLLGQLATDRNDGVVQHRDLAGDVVEVDWLPPIGFLRHQPPSIPLLDKHDGWRVGRVQHLERSRESGLLAFAEIADDEAQLLEIGGRPWFLSAGVTTLSVRPNHHERALLREVSLTQDPAACGVRPLCWSPDSAAPRSLPWDWDRAWRAGIERMGRAKYRSDRRTEITEIDKLDPIDELLVDPAPTWYGPKRKPVPVATREGPAPTKPRLEPKVYRRNVKGSFLVPVD